MQENTLNLLHIIQQFQVNEPVVTAIPFGNGHINDTYLVTFGQPEATSSPGAQYLLQRINHHVFSDVEGLMKNMDLVTRHLQQRKDHSFVNIQIIPSENGRLFYQDHEGGYWRLQTYVPESMTVEKVTTGEQAKEAGKAFGEFQRLLSDLPAENLSVTIPDFHNMQFRYQQFQEAISRDIVQRKGLVIKEVAFVQDRIERMLDLHHLIENGAVPLRIMHNDTKVNNVLLDQRTHQAICVIDLDTVMPGVVWFDFGDGVRTITNTADEDEKELEKVSLNLDYFRAFALGYLQNAGGVLTDLEVSYLAFSGQYMTFIMGLRFLTDYISGDQYYKIKHPEHNLQRVKAQFTLLTQMENSEEAMKQIIFQEYATCTKNQDKCPEK